jgi:hypothetical protein
VIETRHERALLERTADGTGRVTVGSHHRRELNRLGRKLAADLGGELSVRDEADDAVAFDLTPGEGVYVAPHAPHWVQNGGEVSVSPSITFATAASENRRRVHSINARLRRLGLSPTLPGRRPGADRGKAACSRALGRVRQARA